MLLLCDNNPAIREVAVFAMPDDALGEEAGACVVVEPGQTIDEQELRKLLSNKLARFKVPLYIWFRSDPLPRNPSGKVLKRQLRALYANS